MGKAEHRVVAGSIGLGWVASGLLLAATLLLACSDDSGPRSYDNLGSGDNLGPATTATGRWVEELLLGGELGDTTPVVHRWLAPVVVGVTGNPALGEPGDALDSAVQALNAPVANSGFTLTIDPASSAPAIEIVIGTAADLAARKQQENIPTVTGSAWVWFDENQALWRALVFVEVGTEIELVLTEGLARALGVLQSSTIFADSIFFADGFSEFSSRDATLIEFLYTQLAPGDVRADVRSAFDAWWPNPE